MRVRFTSRAMAVVALACAVSGLPGGAAQAQERASGALVVAQDDPDQAPVDDPSSAAALLVRIDRLENKVRTLTGQIQELQFQNKRLDDALRKMQQDVDFRFQDLNRSAPAPGGKPPLQRHGDAGDAASPVRAADATPDATVPADAPVALATPAVEPAKPQRHGDAFDPASDPNAPGAPRPLGTTPPSAPLRTTIGASTAPAVPTRPADAPPHAPLDLLHGPAAVATPDAPPPVAVAPAGSVASLESDARPAAGDAGTSGASARNDYDAALGFYRAGQFDDAAGHLLDFVQKYPHDRLVPDATFYLGESFARLGRQREAAEQFLKLSTDYNRSARAPDALLRLGVALNALGANAQACATYQEVGRKYPNAAPDVRAGVERELKRARC